MFNLHPYSMDAAATNFVPKANKDPLLKINDKEVVWKYEKNGDSGIIMTPTKKAIKAQYDTRMITDSNAKANSKPQVGSCMYKVKVWGCWDKMSTKYNALATDHDDDMCEPMVDIEEGCTHNTANVANYKASANLEDGLCTCKAGYTPTYFVRDAQGCAHRRPVTFPTKKKTKNKKTRARARFFFEFLRPDHHRPLDGTNNGTPTTEKA